MKNIFDFFYCKIKTSNFYLVLLSIKNIKKIIIYNKKLNSWYF